MESRAYIMMTSSNGIIFCVTGHLCGELTGHRWRPVTRSFDVFFDLRLNERLNKQSWGWWFQTPSRPLWRHSNDSVLRRLSFPSQTSRRIWGVLCWKQVSGAGISNYIPVFLWLFVPALDICFWYNTLHICIVSHQMYKMFCVALLRCGCVFRPKPSIRLIWQYSIELHCFVITLEQSPV